MTSLTQEVYHTLVTRCHLDEVEVDSELQRGVQRRCSSTVRAGRYAREAGVRVTALHMRVTYVSANMDVRNSCSEPDNIHPLLTIQIGNALFRAQEGWGGEGGGGEGIVMFCMP